MNSKLENKKNASATLSQDCRWNSYFLALALITIVAGGVRLCKLGDYPPGFGQDEAVGAYDAWSLLTTGREHHGDFWPLNSRQFGDYPPSTPTFLTMPFVAVLGPTILATRLPCALLNTVAVFFFGLLTGRLFRSKAAGLFAAALLAVSPWNILFSRFAVAVGYIHCFLAAGLWMLHRMLTGEGKWDKSYTMAAAVGVVLFLWTHEYVGQYLFAPLIIGLAMLIWGRGKWGRIFVAGGVYSLFMLAAIIVRFQLPGAAIGRMHVHSVFYTDHPLAIFWSNYWEYQSFTFLFNAPGMLPLHQIPGVAHINHQLSWFYVIGLVALAMAVAVPGRLLQLMGRPDDQEAGRSWRRSAVFVIAWLVLAPVPGALFVHQMYTARVTQLLTGVLLVCALGCGVVWHLLRRIPVRALAPVYAVLMAAYLGLQTFKTGRGLAQSSAFFKWHLQNGMPEVMQYLARQPNVRSVKVSPMLQGYIYHLLFTPVHPAKMNYAEVAPRPLEDPDRWRYDLVSKIGSYYFEQSLNAGEVASNATLRYQVKDSDDLWFDLYEKDGDWFVIRR